MTAAFAPHRHDATATQASRIAFLTCHDKARLVVDALAPLGFVVEPNSACDTDQFGTFSREIPRQGSAHDAAQRKAELGCTLAGTRYGLGSEGCFGRDPHLGWMPWDYEILCLWDAELNYAVFAMAGSGATNYAHAEIDSLEAADSFARRAQFPEHALILGRPGEPWFRKAIQDPAVLMDAVGQVLAHQPSVWLETDMRAHLNPQRQVVITEAARQLARRLASHCPQCNAPGYAIARHEPGLLCEDCGLTTALAAAHIWECPACRHQQRQAVAHLASAGDCERCNP